MLKLQYFGLLMWRANSLEKTLILGKTEGRRKRGQQRMRWLDYIAQWTRIWANTSRQWRTREPGLLQPMGSQRVRHDLVTRQQQRKIACALNVMVIIAWASLCPRFQFVNCPSFLSLVLIQSSWEGKVWHSQHWEKEAIQQRWIQSSETWTTHLADLYEATLETPCYASTQFPHLGFRDGGGKGRVLIRVSASATDLGTVMTFLSEFFPRVDSVHHLEAGEVSTMVILPPSGQKLVLQEWKRETF